MINVMIQSLSKDDLLAQGVVKGRLDARVDVLKGLLLREMPDVDPELVKRITSDVKAVGKGRNVIAHNPMLSDERDEPPTRIVVLRGDPPYKEYKHKEVADLTRQSLQVLKELDKLNEAVKARC